MPNATATAPPAPPLTGFDRWWVSSTLALRAPAYEVARDAYEAGRADALDGLNAPGLPMVQRRTLDFIVKYRAENRNSPTLQEVADHFGVRKVSVFEAVVNLERKGLIRRTPRKSRSIEVVNGNGIAAEVTAMPVPDLTLYEHIELDEFNRLVMSGSFADDPRQASFGYDYGEPYNPKRNAWGTLKDGRQVRTVLR